MPKVDFYLIPENSLEASLIFVCRLLDKAYQQKQQVYVHMNNEVEAQKLDDLLWTFRDEGFIPHNLLNQLPAIKPPILIGFNQEPAEPHNILLNLTKDILPFYDKFKRVIEIVPNESKFKEICRQKFRQYKEANCELMTHDLTKSPLHGRGIKGVG